MDVSEMIAKMGGGTELARLLGTTPQAVSNMKARGSIPPEYWAALIAAAAERGIEGVTYEVLQAIASANAVKRRGEHRASA